MPYADDLLLVFDVESVGLHGEGFAYGYVVVDAATGEEVDSGWSACPPEYAHGTAEGHAWVKEHVPPLQAACSVPRCVRSHFWMDYMKWKERGATLWADCDWPVEARFLAACVDDDPIERQWQGPYPLHEIATLRLAAGLDQLGTEERRENEPQHHPMGDARQSARLLLEALARCRAATA